MVKMPESSRFAAVELGLGGDGAGLEGRASVGLERATVATGAGDLDSDEGAGGGGRPGAGETTEGRPIDGQGWDAEEGEPPPREGRGLGEPPRRRSRASQALREGDTSP